MRCTSVEMPGKLLASSSRRASSGASRETSGLRTMIINTPRYAGLVRAPRRCRNASTPNRWRRARPLRSSSWGRKGRDQVGERPARTGEDVRAVADDQGVEVDLGQASQAGLEPGQVV